MAETGRSLGRDTGSRAEQTGPTQPQTRSSSDRIEMDNLSPHSNAASSTTVPPANPDTSAPEASSSNAAATTKTDAVRIPLPDKDESFYSQASPAPLGDVASTIPEAPLPPSTKALGKAPATASSTPEQDALEINPAEYGAEDELFVRIELMPTSSNTRHPFRIDERYLTKRNVAVTGKTEDGRVDPFSITVYTLKELILREWRKEWEKPPREPVSIRLIYFGKMLDDRQPLSNYNFSKTQTNIVHMTVKPQEIVDEEEANKRVKDSGSPGGRNGCCVIL